MPEFLSRVPALEFHETRAPNRYLLITPCRDESAYMQSTINSVVAQTVPPAKWIIVDDGSTDGTPDILKEASRKHSFITVIHRGQRTDRSVGPGVVQAFNTGLRTVSLDDFDYVCKLDADLEFGPRYFERLMTEFAADPWLGTMSGKAFLRDDAGEREERIGDENSLGAAKFYRVDCFRDIGGFVPHVGWDAIDGHMSRLRGWKATSIKDPDLKIIHLRRMGSSHINFWTGRLRWGRLKYFIGSAWYYVLAASIYRMFERPFLISGTGIIAGYIQAAFQRHDRFGDAECRRAIRRFELESLVRGKRRALKRYHAQIEQDYSERTNRCTVLPQSELEFPFASVSITTDEGGLP